MFINALGPKRQKRNSKFILQPFVFKNVPVGDISPNSPCVHFLEFISEPGMMGLWLFLWLCDYMIHEWAARLLFAL